MIAVPQGFLPLQHRKSTRLLEVLAKAVTNKKKKSDTKKEEVNIKNKKEIYIQRKGTEHRKLTLYYYSNTN